MGRNVSGLHCPIEEYPHSDSGNCVMIPRFNLAYYSQDASTQAVT